MAESSDFATEGDPTHLAYDPTAPITGPGITVARCAHGNGAFADRDFAAGETIQTFYTPFVDEIDPEHSWLTLKVGDKYWSEPTNPEYSWSNFLDHSDTPNAEFTNFDFETGRGDLVTLRPIKAGEEILIDYGKYSPQNVEDVVPDIAADQATYDVISDVAPETEGYDPEVLKLEEEIKKLEEEVGLHSEGRWDKPPAPDADPHQQSLREAYYQLADEVGDDLQKWVETGLVNPMEGDELIRLQTAAKEAVMNNDLETAGASLHQLLEFVEKVKQPTI
jgi:hypothetical protein